ncbi:hypothetical protein BC351_22245 [Paenibacillus ferrarius]|uniref:SLH domain-containing protein n=1 Tax=Paenibacillus ferrarius TaxID=1469647 RepID=A0A1V4HMY6_9BACL|nr:hypothetical protein BC351_22245 [Paenibacillus ferrarius]
MYIAVNDGTIHALNPSDGKEKWTSKIGFTFTVYLTTGKDGTIYLSNNTDTFYAIKPNGSIKWTYQAGGIIKTASAVGPDGTIYFGAADNKLYALLPDGTKLWDVSLGGNPSAPAIGADGTIYVSTSDQNLSAFGPDKTLKWKTTFRKAITAPIVGPNGTIHLQSADGMVHALNPSDGSTQWRHDIGTPAEITPPAIGADGTVYTVEPIDANMNLFALRVPIDGITLNKTSLNLKTNESENLSVKLSPENAPNQKVVWKSSNEGVATVDNTGKVFALSSGKATISAKSDDGGKIATCEVVVESPAGAIEVVSVNVSPAALSLTANQSGNLTASILPANATNHKVIWESSNSGIAQVNESGQVMGISPGTAVISAKTIDGGYSATSQITVLKGTATQGSAPFTDTNGHWANKEIAKAYELHIVNGYPDFTFRPDGSVTRAEFVVMLMNALKPEVQGAELTFQDKSEIAVWAEKAISQTVQLGIVSGYPDGTFRPGANITHAEMATIVSKTSGIPLDSSMRTGFTDDADIPDWARGAVSAAEKNGIIIVGGKTSGSFTPQALSTRAEAAAWLVNMLGIQAKG